MEKRSKVKTLKIILVLFFVFAPFFAPILHAQTAWTTADSGKVDWDVGRYGYQDFNGTINGTGTLYSHPFNIDRTEGILEFAGYQSQANDSSYLRLVLQKRFSTSLSWQAYDSLAIMDSAATTQKFGTDTIATVNGQYRWLVQGKTGNGQNTTFKFVVFWLKKVFGN